MESCTDQQGIHLRSGSERCDWYRTTSRSIPLEWAALVSIAGKIGCSAETLGHWVRQAERDAGLRPGTSTEERARLKDLERENRELRWANEILRKASAYFAVA